MPSMMRGRVLRVGAVATGAIAALALVAAPGATAGKGGKDQGAKVKILRSKGGTPTIKARNYRSLGYGYGYAFAEDNICTIADSYVTVSAQRSRFFGPDEESPAGAENLDSDFFYQRIKDRGIVEELADRKPPQGPKGEVKKAIKGYVDGYNAYLKRTGVANIPDPRCAGEPWVRKIKPIDVYRRFYELLLAGSQGAAIDGIAGAQPPAAPRLDDNPSRAEVRSAARAMEAERPLGDGLGSNAYGLGSEATKTGSGMVLANPHFPWSGPLRFYQSHLMVPGKLNVSGGSLYGVPLVLIGHTKQLAWSHTVSTAFRFTPIELTLQPGSPTTYMVDGQPEQMEADTVTVQVKQPDGSLAPQSRTLYWTRYGPIVNEIQGQSIFAWGTSRAYAMFDANAENFRMLNHFFDTNHAQSTKELLKILRRYEGVPWVNTIAADSKGKALYADIGSIPNVTDERATSCAGPVLGALVFGAAGLPVLDGARSECAPASDPQAAADGIFAGEDLPSLQRRDYVANMNDSYWLTNPEQRLEGFPRIIGSEGTGRSLRTRLGLIQIEQRLAGTDAFSGNRFTRGQLQNLVFQNRHYGGELWNDQLVAYCQANPTMTGSSGPVDVSGACTALAGWDGKMNLDSTGAVLFARFMDHFGGGFATPFDVNDPVHTPSGLDTTDPDLEPSLADAVTDLQAAGIPLDAPLSAGQWEMRGSERIPIHGGQGGQGVFNAIGAPWEDGAGYSDIVAGSSFVMVTSFEGGCPKDRSILTYSLSENPESKHYADQTRMFSRKEWVNPPFCAREVREAARSKRVLRP